MFFLEGKFENRFSTSHSLGLKQFLLDFPQIGWVLMSKIGRYFCWFHVRISLLGKLTAYLLQNSCISHQSSESLRPWYKTLSQNHPIFLELRNCLWWWC